MMRHTHTTIAQSNVNHRLGLMILTLAVLTLTACGWNAASQTYENQNLPSDEPLVVEPKLEPPKVDNNPCKVQSFTLFFVDTKSRSTKEVRCDTGKTLNLARSDISETEYRNARVDNLPIETWYILVDPSKAEKNFKKPGTITNEELIGLSRIYNLRYHQRQESTGLLVYLFKSETLAP